MFEMVYNCSGYTQIIQKKIISQRRDAWYNA